MNVTHEFETTQGDELSLGEMRNATWRVVETFVDVAEEPIRAVFTHRVEVHHVDDLTIGAMPCPVCGAPPGGVHGPHGGGEEVQP